MDGGLEGVVAAETVLTDIDGATGTWLLRGHPPGEVIAAYGYEGATALLWEGFARSGLTRAAIVEAFAAGRATAFARLPGWLSMARGRPIGEGVRSLLAALPDDSTPAEIAAALPVGIAALLRAERGAEPVPPDPRLATAADFLRMTTGTLAAPPLARALDAYLTVVIDNGLAASTFAARVIASTRASLASAVLGGYCALTGPLHGGAPGPVLDMLDAIGSVDNIDPWLERALDSGASGAAAIPVPMRSRRRCCGSAPRWAVSALPRRSSAARSPPSTTASPNACSRRMSSSTPRSCSRLWACRARALRRSSRSRGAPAGSRMRWSSKRPAASSAPPHATSVPRRRRREASDIFGAKLAGSKPDRSRRPWPKHFTAGAAKRRSPCSRSMSGSRSCPF